MPGISKEGPLFTTASAEVLLALEATRSLTGVSVQTFYREATPTSIRTESGTVVMSSSLKHRHGPPVITVVPEICVRNTHLSHVLPTGVSPIHWFS